MNEITSIISAVAAVLEANGINASASFPGESFKRKTSPAVAVGLGAGRGIAAGMVEYLGERYDSTADNYKELYGKRLDIDLELSIYAPVSSGASGCLNTAAAIVDVLGDFPAGIKVKSFECGDVTYDKKSDMFLEHMTVRCLCLLYAESGNESEITDFTLRGVLSN